MREQRVRELADAIAIAWISRHNRREVDPLTDAGRQTCREIAAVASRVAAAIVATDPATVTALDSATPIPADPRS